MTDYGTLKTKGVKLQARTTICTPDLFKSPAGLSMQTTCVDGGPGFESYVYSDSGCKLGKKVTYNFEMPASEYPDSCKNYPQRISCGTSLEPNSAVPTSSSSSSKTGAIVGGIFGFIALLAILYYFFVYVPAQKAAAEAALRADVETANSPRTNPLQN